MRWVLRQVFLNDVNDQACSCHIMVTKHFCSAFPGYKCLQGTRRQKRSLDFQKKMSGIGMSVPLGGLKILAEGGKGMCLGSRGKK